MTLPKGVDSATIAAKIAADLPDGAYVNLGIGRPEKVAQHVPEGKAIVLHTENGLLGMGPEPEPGSGDPDLINAGKRQVTALPGAAFFHHADSFAMIRGGHLDVCVLGAYEVSAGGDLANWSTGDPKAAPAVGGAMDLVSGARQVLVMTQHVTRDGAAKLMADCSLPLTGAGVVDRVYTDLGVFRPGGDAFEVLELYPGIDLPEVQALTAAPLRDERECGAIT